jgi:hypothetical protein
MQVLALVLCILLLIVYLVVSYRYIYSVQYFGIVLIIAAFLLLLIIWSKLFYYIEFFGTSPGTLVQLSANHVPTADDYQSRSDYQEQLKRESIELTGSL